MRDFLVYGDCSTLDRSDQYSLAIPFRNYTHLEGKYCHQPSVSETTRCVSDDFIEIIDNSRQNVVPFEVERIERVSELTTRETERVCLCERELTRKRVRVGAKIRTFS